MTGIIGHALSVFMGFLAIMGLILAVIGVQMLIDGITGAIRMAQ